MRRFYSTLMFFLIAITSMAQGWPENYKGVMLQGFSWDSFVDTQWTNLESQADELSGYFDLIWVPQSGNCNSAYNQMGYTPVYYFNQNSSFGTEAQLRSMIKAFKDRNVGIIADVVVNHRNNMGDNGSWVDYPAEEYNGEIYQMLSTDICGNDDKGKTKDWATKNGFSLGNNDTGEDWDGCRDLDHTSENVQKIIKVYLKYLLNDLGYAGFRYDMTKGFKRSYLADYNYDAQPTFSVGEYWDGNKSTLKSVINQQKKDDVVQSATFDFAFRYSARDACNENNWSKLANGGLATEDGYSRYAVTFVENHDMQDRGNVTGYTKDPITKNIEAANAWLMAMPGTPCVFLLHWKSYKNEIKQMILARKAAGISNQSEWKQISSTNAYYQLETTGSNGKLYAFLGSGSLADDAYVKILSGSKYSYYLSKTTETPWVSLAEGTYTEPQENTLTAVSESADAQLVYTLDGADPTAASTKVSSATNITISESCTLKVGLLVDGVVKKIITRKYVIKPFVAHKATIYLKDPNWNTSVYFYAWANDGKNTQLLGGWPGTAITATKEIDGNKWYYQEFDVDSKDYSFNIIFNQGNGKQQTVDIGPITEDTYYEIGDLVNGKFSVNNITKTVTGISSVKMAPDNDAIVKVYTLDGRLVRTAPKGSDALSGLAKGIYIVNKKKFILK